MKVMGSVGRCCCGQVDPPVKEGGGRAWNAELDLTFSNIHEIDQTFGNGEYSFGVDNPTEAADYTSSVYVDGGVRGIPYNLKVQRQADGYKQVCEGVTNAAPQGTGWFNTQQFLVAVCEQEPYPIGLTWYEGRYYQQGQLPLVSDSTGVGIPWRLDVDIADSSGSQRYTQPFGNWAYQDTQIRVNNTAFTWYGSGWATGFPDPKTTNVWYARTRQNVLLKLTSGGVDIPVIFPSTITLKSDALSRDSYFEIDGQAIDQDIAWGQYNTVQQCLTGWPPMVHTIIYPLYTQAVPQAMTAPDQVIEIERVKYQLDNGLDQFTGAYGWTLSNANWTEAAGVIVADNSDLPTPATAVPSRYAVTSVPLVNNNWYVIRFKAEELPLPSPTQPDLNTSYNPEVQVNNKIVSYSSDFEPRNRVNEALFFKTEPSGDTVIKFFGFASKSFQLSDIGFYRVKK